MWLFSRQPKAIPATTRGSVELIGLPGSGKHVVAPLLRTALSQLGWMPVIPERCPFTACRLTDVDADPLFSTLLQNHLHRLIRDGCRQPYLSGYLQHTAAILTAEYSRATSVGRPAVFLNESLLHHYGPELAHLVNTRGANKFRNSVLYPNRIAVMTTAPRAEILERLEARRGQNVHWDWVSAYGTRLHDWLDQSDDRLHRLVSTLQAHGVQITTIEVHNNQRGTIESNIREFISQVAKRLCHD